MLSRTHLTRFRSPSDAADLEGDWGGGGDRSDAIVVRGHAAGAG